MNSLWSSEYSGSPFELFGMPHVSVLAMVGLVGLTLVIWGGRINPDRWKSLRLTLAVLLVVNELLWHVWALMEHRYTLEEMLPLHLCSIMVWLSAYALVTSDRRLYEAMYFLGIAGALQALITPDAGKFGFPHFRFMQTMISHGLVFVAGIYVASVEGYRPTARSIVRVFVALNVYALVVGLINVVVGSNYLYVNARPDTPSIIDMMPDWPWYLIYLEVIAVSLLVAMYLPFAKRTGETDVSAREINRSIEAVAEGSTSK